MKTDLSKKKYPCQEQIHLVGEGGGILGEGMLWGHAL